MKSESKKEEETERCYMIFLLDFGNEILSVESKRVLLKRYLKMTMFHLIELINFVLSIEISLIFNHKLCDSQKKSVCLFFHLMNHKNLF